MEVSHMHYTDLDVLRNKTSCADHVMTFEFGGGATLGCLIPPAMTSFVLIHLLQRKKNKKKESI
jgi:hypothetical protein